MRYICLLLVWPALCLAQQGKEVRATTEDGRRVLLRPDGTWVEAPKTQAATGATPSAGSFTKPASSTRKVASSFGDFVLWIDPARWTESKREQGRITFQHKNGQAYATLISESLSVPTAAMKGIVLANAHNADPAASIVGEEMRTVNGRDVLCLLLEGKIQGLPFQYYGYYYGGSSGNVQVVTYTLKTAFAANQQDFTNLLNGLAVSDKPIEAPAETEASGKTVIPLIDGKLTITADRASWSAPARKDDGRITLQHAKGGGYAIIVPETLQIPLDALPEVALSNAKGADPDAKIIFQEKRKVNGLDVMAVKLSVTSAKIPFIFYSYNYGGPEGTVQVITYTTPTSFSEYESDFNELLASLARKR